MAFPSTNTNDCATAWSVIRSTAGLMKSQAQAMASALTITRRAVLDFGNGLADNLATFNACVGVPGLPAYAREQADNPNLDIQAEFQAMRAQLVATQDWIVANFPRDGAGNLAVYAFDGNKRFADVNLTALQATAFKNQLNALIATVA